MPFFGTMAVRQAVSEVVDKTARAAEILASDPRVQLVYLFGSAIDSPAPGDLDLAIWADPPLAIDELMKRRADLVLVVKAPLDLVSLNSASIALAHEIVEYGRCLYARDSDIETDVVTRTRALYWDFKPYRDEQWRLAGRRLDERLSGS